MPFTATFYNGKVWFAELIPSSRSQGYATCGMSSDRYRLVNIKPGRNNKPRVERDLRLPFTSFELFADGGRLWIGNRGYLKNGKLTILDFKEKFGNTTPLFPYHGLPSMIGKHADEFTLYSFSDGKWTNRNTFKINHENQYHGWISSFLKVVSDGNEMYLFVRHNDTLYYHKGMPSEMDANPENWQKITTFHGYEWSTGMLNSQPVAFIVIKRATIVENVAGFRRNNGKWVRFFNSSTALSASRTAIVPCTDCERETIVIFRKAISGYLKIATVETDKAVSTITIKSTDTKFLILFAMLLLMLIVCVATSNPLLSKRIGKIIYKDSKVFPTNNINIIEIMRKDYSRAKHHKIRKGPLSKNVLYIVQKASANNGFRAYAPSFVYALSFENTKDGVFIGFTAKDTSHVLLVVLLPLILFPIYILSHILPARGIIFIVVFFALFMLAIYMISKNNIKKRAETFKCIFVELLYSLGIEKPPES